MDTNGCSTGFSPRCFGKYHTITSCFLSSNHTPGAAGRWGGLNQPPEGFRDAPTQENQATPLARLQTAVSNTSRGLKANCLPLWQRARGWCLFFYLQDFFSHCYSYPDCWSAGAENSKLNWVRISIYFASTDLATNKPMSHFWSGPALFLSWRRSQRTENRKPSQIITRDIFSFKLSSFSFKLSFYVLLLLFFCLICSSPTKTGLPLPTVVPHEAPIYLPIQSNCSVYWPVHQSAHTRHDTESTILSQLNGLI